MEKKITEPKYWVGDTVVYRVGNKYPRQGVIISAYFNSDWSKECWKYYINNEKEELNEIDIVYIKS